MFIQVRLLNGFSRPLWYQAPDHWSDQQTFIGAIMQVPVRTQLLPAVVVDEQKHKPKTPFEIRSAHGMEAFPHDPSYQAFIAKLAAYHRIDHVVLIKRIAHFLHEHTEKEYVISKASGYTKKEVLLTDEQTIAVDFIRNALDTRLFTPIVLHGVTGSGKTEVYCKAIEHAHQQKKSVIFLIPEVTLAVNFEKRLRASLDEDITLLSFHSSVPAKEKKALWHAILEKKPIVIVGVHMPILLPIANLGLIIVDEEHDTGYQEKKHPKINTRDAALMRAQIANIPIILGSATPSISTLYNVKKRGWHFFQLKKRFAGAFPTIQTVSLSDKKQRRNFWISTPLLTQIADRLEKKEQTIIFLNRRGYSFFVQCKKCTFIFTCNSCSVSLTLHDNNRLSCHYCGLTNQLPAQCVQCSAPDTQFLKKGIGTQQVVSILKDLFINARIERADMDATINKKKWQQTMRDFTDHKIDILVGTQTITKGYDFPRVTLVGILWADLNLHFPMYNAAETTLQQIIQVAGRAGRATAQSTVIVQAMADHEIFNHLHETDYLNFYQTELEKRMLLGYPPEKRLAQLEIKHPQEEIVEREAQHIATLLIHANSSCTHTQILGPARPPVYKIKNINMRVIYIKSENLTTIMNLMNVVEKESWHSSILFTPNPLT